MVENCDFKENSVSIHYDELSELYRKIWGPHLHHGLWENGDEDRERACDKLTERVLGKLGDLKGKKVLDIGCGYGESSRRAAKLGADVTGITLSQKQFEYASSQGSAKYVRGDWMKNPFENECFDAAYSIECFSHIQHKNKFFKEVYDKLKPGGMFSMAAWMCKSYPGKAERRYFLEPICKEGRLPSLCSKQEIEWKLKGAGFELVSSEDLSKKVDKTWGESLKSLIVNLSDKDLREYLGNSANSERMFALTAARIWLGFKAGSMRYGMFSARKA